MIASATPEVLETYVRRYTSMGFKPVLFQRNDSKGPSRKGWNSESNAIEDYQRQIHNGYSQIGLMLGSEGIEGNDLYLCDIDLDCAETRDIASMFLPETTMISGRETAPRSHYWYITRGESKAQKFTDPIRETDKNGERSMLVEFRCNIGTQTMVAPSIHPPTGEQIKWHAKLELPQPIQPDIMRPRLVGIASAALIGRYWPSEGTRQDAALALAGALLSEKIGAQYAMRFLRAVLTVSGDTDEIERRCTTIASTVQKIDAGEPVAGWGKLLDHFDPRIIDRVKRWLGVKSKNATPLDADARQFTDTGNAERLAQTQRDKAIYVQEHKRWYAWDGQRFLDDRGLQVYRIATDSIKQLYNEAKDASSTDERERIAKHAVRSESLLAIEAMIKLARPLMSVSVNKLDQQPWHINTQNGVFDIKTQTLIPHTPNQYHTKIANVSYDPLAQAPFWRDMIAKIFNNDKDLMWYVQKAVGYSATGGIPERYIFIPYGKGSNGKSTFISAIAYVLGDYAMRTRTQTLLSRRNDDSGANEDVADLYGSRFVYASEPESGKRLAESLIKDLTGGDVQKARKLYGDLFEFHPTSKIWLLCNYKPIVHGTDDGIWSRLKVIPFIYQFIGAEQRRREEIDAILRSEAAGILNWILEGCQGYITEGLIEPASISEEITSYKTEMDTIGRWIKESCNVSSDQMSTFLDLYRSYSHWCEQYGEYPRPRKIFEQELHHRGFERKEAKNGAAWWKGIAEIDRGTATW